MPDAVDLGFAARLPPAEAVEYFANKGYGAIDGWREAWQEAHSRAFVVARAARLDVLSTIRGSLDDALAKGTTREQFMREMEPRLKALGWWGREVRVDAAGGAELVQLGSPWRLKTIFDTNMRSVREAGRYRRAVQNVESRPYWMYTARMDSRTRDSHAAMNGRVFRHDDPIWRTFWPPNDFNCRCRVRALTEAQVRRRGLTVESSEGHLETIRQQVGVDKRTGEILYRPATRFRAPGVDMTPGPGWNYNPGANPGEPFGPVRGGGPVPPPEVVGGQTTWRELGLPPARDLPATPSPGPSADTGGTPRQMLMDALDDAGGRTVQIRANGVEETVFRGVESPVGEVLLTEGFVTHLIDHHAGEVRERWRQYILPTLRDPAEVWLVATLLDDGRIGYRRVFVGRFDDGRGTTGVVQEEPFGEMAWTFHRDDRAGTRQRKGYLLYEKERRR